VSPAATLFQVFYSLPYPLSSFLFSLLLTALITHRLTCEHFFARCFHIHSSTLTLLHLLPSSHCSPSLCSPPCMVIRLLVMITHSFIARCIPTACYLPTLLTKSSSSSSTSTSDLLCLLAAPPSPPRLTLIQLIALYSTCAHSLLDLLITAQCTRIVKTMIHHCHES